MVNLVAAVMAMANGPPPLPQLLCCLLLKVNLAFLFLRARAQTTLSNVVKQLSPNQNPQEKKSVRCFHGKTKTDKGWTASQEKEHLFHGLLPT